jgi:osmotically inducible protein OsmC
MAATRTASAHWEGSLTEGAGQVTLESSGLGTYDVTWAARTEEPEGRTSPEELIAAAHSTCYSMAFSNALAQSGHPPASLDTTANVTFQPGPGITGVALSVTGDVPGMTAEEFQEAAEAAKTACPVSQALKAVPITLEAHFKG